MTIDKIENLSYDKVKEMAIEEIRIKEHDCFLVDFGEAFGYSILVFKNGKHVHFANDYELHHQWLVKEQGREALRQHYIDVMNRHLYTDAELMEPVKSYDDYKLKYYFLQNYWIMRFDYLSMFAISAEDKKERDRKKKDFPFVNPVSFCYVNDKEIIDTQLKFQIHLTAEYGKLKNDNETFREMVRMELANHEACITCDYTDALDALGMKFEDLPEDKQEIVKKELKKIVDSYY